MRKTATKEELKQIRLSKGMTQQQFGEWVGYAKGCAQTRISDIERGSRAVPASVELFLIKNINQLN